MKKSRASKHLSRKDSQTSKTAQNYCNSPWAIPRSKYTSETHPKLRQDATNPPASFMNVTPRERENDCVAKRTGEREWEWETDGEEKSR